MNNQVFVNELIQWKSKNSNLPDITERILWIDEGNIITYVFDIHTDKGFPKIRRVEEIIDALENCDAEKQYNEPFQRLVREENLSESEKQIRDRDWNYIKSLVESNNEPDIFLREKRGPLVKRISEKYNVSVPTLYRLLRRYWQRGKNKNSMLPDFEKCGGKGRPKTAGNKKLGRPKKNAALLGKGVNVDEKTKKIFHIAIEKYYHTAKSNPLATAYNLMLLEFFTEDYTFDNGIKRAILIPRNMIPTKRQFEYWYKKEFDIKKAIVSRKGEKEFELNYRKVLGTSERKAFGPGSVYQIDATVADVYLRSRYNRDWIIGRPVIYSIIDVFSRMIAGLYVGLEGPSWLGAMMALANAMCDKVKYCRDYNIDITKADWPCYHLPEIILADRGELEGYRIEPFIESIGVKVQNTPTNRADWKGIIEQHFNVTHAKVKPFLPGFVEKDFGKRGARDYRLDAKLDIFDFTNLIIRCALKHNHRNWLNNYKRDKNLIEDDINPLPIELWEWGITNRSGRLRTIPENAVKLNLLPHDKASVTDRGIRFKKVLYSSAYAINNLWFETARANGSWKVDITYDPRDMTNIYIKGEDNRSFEVCNVIDKDRFGGMTLEEIIYLNEYEKLKGELNWQKSKQGDLDLICEIQNVVDDAINRDKDIPETGSKQSRIKGIKEHRKVEKRINRSNEAFKLGRNEIDSGKLAPVIPMKKDYEDDDLSYPDHLELLKSIQKEMQKTDE